MGTGLVAVRAPALQAALLERLQVASFRSSCRPDEEAHQRMPSINCYSKLVAQRPRTRTGAA